MSNPILKTLILEMIESYLEESYDLYVEGSIKGSGQDRKAILKRSFRAGQTNKFNDMASRGMHSSDQIKKKYTGKRTKPGIFDRNDTDYNAQAKSEKHPGFSNETDKKDEHGRRNADVLARRSDNKTDSMVKRNAIRALSNRKKSQGA